MRSKHRDEATNTLVELSARDIDLRGEVLAVALGERGEPEVEASDIPVPLTPEQIVAEAQQAQEQAQSDAVETPATNAEPVKDSDGQHAEAGPETT
jgi:hypothetical protein